MELKEEMVSQETVYQGIIVNVRRDKAKLPDGRLTNREVVEHPGGVAIFAMDDQDRVAMVRQYRYPMGEIVLELPAGKLEKGEDPRDSGLRELREETGLTEESLEELRLRYITLRMKNGEIRQNYYFFAGLKPGAAVRGTCDEGRLEWVPYDSVLKREMPFTAKSILRHYLRVGCRTRCIYGSVTEAEDSAFTELAEF